MKINKLQILLFFISAILSFSSVAQQNENTETFLGIGSRINGSIVPQGINNSSYGLQRGDASNKDWYAVTGIILTYEFFKDVVCPK